jgi:hypothetical protein
LLKQVEKNPHHGVKMEAGGEGLDKGARNGISFKFFAGLFLVIMVSFKGPNKGSICASTAG